MILRFLNWLFGITPEHHDLCSVCGTELVRDGWEVWCAECEEQNAQISGGTPSAESDC